MSVWRYIVWILTWLSGDEVAWRQASARASAAVHVARASMVPEPPPPAPKPSPAPERPTRSNP